MTVIISYRCILKELLTILIQKFGSLRDHRLTFFNYNIVIYLKTVFIVANSAYPDCMLPNAVFHLGLHHLLKYLFTDIHIGNIWPSSCNFSVLKFIILSAHEELSSGTKILNVDTCLHTCYIFMCVNCEGSFKICTHDTWR